MKHLEQSDYLPLSPLTPTNKLTTMSLTAKQTIESGKAILGIEFGSTRIKAVLIDQENKPIAQGSHLFPQTFAYFPHSSTFPRETTLTHSTSLHSLPLTRFPPDSHTPPCSSTFKHVSHSHFYQWPPSLKNEQRIARSPSCLGVSPSFLAPTFILLDPSKRTFNPPSIPFP